jgi:hypothetical protein
MDFSTLAIIFFGVLSVVIVICTVILYPELKDMIKEFRRE